MHIEKQIKGIEDAVRNALQLRELDYREAIVQAYTLVKTYYPDAQIEVDCDIFDETFHMYFSSASKDKDKELFEDFKDVCAFVRLHRSEE